MRARAQVANACCQGRLVSVLEGGYRIQGGPVSAFARSVAAHVHALAEPNFQVSPYNIHLHGSNQLHACLGAHACPNFQVLNLQLTFAWQQPAARPSRGSCLRRHSTALKGLRSQTCSCAAAKDCCRCPSLYVADP